MSGEYFDLNLSSSSVVFGGKKSFASSGKVFGVFVDFSDLCDEFEGWVQDFHRSENLAMDRCDVDCVVSRF